MSRKLSKNLVKARALVEPRPYTLIDAVPLLIKAKYAKFDETVDLTHALGRRPPSTPTRWSAGRSSCRTAWVRARSSL
jgi:ribosomal protein L1